MGWSSGTMVFSEIIEVLKDTVGDIPTRSEIYSGLIQVFENADCDNLDECIGEDIAFDDVWNELHPSEDTDEEYYDSESGDWIIETKDRSESED
jgi:hypothetical protein